MCTHFAQMGLDVELVSLYAYRQGNIPRRDLFAHYGIDSPNFRLTILPAPLKPSHPVWWSQSWTVGLNVAYGLWKKFSFKPTQRVIFYARSPAALYAYWWLRHLYAAQRPLFFLETHAMLNGKGANQVIQRVDGLIVSSQRLAKDMHQQKAIPLERLQTAYLAPNALPSPLTQAEACHALGLPPKPYIVYTGKLLMPEVHMVLETAVQIAQTIPEAEFLLVGGNPDILQACEAELHQRGLRNVRFVGFVAPAQVALYQMAASVLFVYLDSQRNIISYITPSKLFDYLQAGRPIVASDYPILHEILHHEQNALLIEPHSPTALAQAIARLLQNPALANRLSQQAAQDGQAYSWEKRVQLIWAFMQKIDALAEAH